jgi:hypothetical protein
MAQAMTKFHQRKMRARGLRELSPRECLRPRLRRVNAGVPGIGDAFTLKIRDYMEIAAATAVNFQILYTIAVGGQYTPIGGTAYNKNRRDTNIVQPGMLGNPRRFMVKGLSCSNRGDIAAADWNQFFFNSLVTFKIDEKIYFECTPAELPGGAGAWGFSQAFQATAAAASYGCISNGNPRADSIFTLEGQEWIAAMQNFSVVIDPTLFHSGAFTTAAAAGTTFGTGIKLNFNIEGILVGPVL